MTTDTVRSVPLFESLNDEAAWALCNLLSVRQAPKGAVLFRAGEPGDSMYLVESGAVKVSVQAADGHEVILAQFGSGDFFGEMALLDGQPRSANAVALETSQLAVLSREHFISFVRSNPDVPLAMLSAVARRLRRTDELLRHRATRNANDEDAAQTTLADRAADVIAEFGGSWKFIGASVSFLIGWVLLNTWLLTEKSFDPFPYVLLNLVLGMMTGLQAPIIMMSQNRQSAKDRLRADLDYQVNLKNELALADILERLQRLEHDYGRMSERRTRASPAGPPVPIAIP